MPWRSISQAPKDGTLILACSAPTWGKTWGDQEMWKAPKTVSWRAYPEGANTPTWRNAKGQPCRPTHFKLMLDAPEEEPMARAPALEAPTPARLRPGDHVAPAQ
ncbi:MAG: hypothetical protein JWO72_1735 [Caulobacteraceae bacterium]|jgi:hypothetical protein|nr:hypothetical protein [Caulobacteraceae bacterium]